MPLSPDQRQRVLDSIEAGHLPLDAPATMYAGYGAGRPCGGCQDPIGPKDVEYEADFADGRRFYLHLRCAGLWHTVRLRREEAAIVMEHSKSVLDHAVKTSKHSAELCNQAEVLTRESEDVVEKARRAKRGAGPPQ